LSVNIADDDLKAFYHKFMVAEAGHYRLFIDLARQYGDVDKVNARWKEYLEHEAEIMKRLELRGDRMH
jgi:tRNA-(ms[2]io[6]A)-hydroxylase